MPFDPKSIDWEKLASLHEQYRERLRGIASDRRQLIYDLPHLQRARKQARFEYKEALEDAKALIARIETIALRLKALRAEWTRRGGTEDNFYLNIKANSLMYQFAQCKKDRKEVIIVNRKRAEAEYRSLALQYEDHIKSIRISKVNYAAVQRIMDENSTIEIVVDYKDKVAHHYDACLETQSFKLSFRKQKYSLGKSTLYVKNDDTWYITDRAGEPEKACYGNEEKKIERLINKLLR